MNITLFGADGRMGRIFREIAEEHNILAVDKGSIIDYSMDCDVAVDFSVPEALDQVLHYCKVKKCPLVHAVTGLDSYQMAKLIEHSKTLPVVHKQNFGQGYESFCSCLRQIATVLPTWDCVILETHKRNKRDKPSGTALEIKKQIENTLALSGHGRPIEVLSQRLGQLSGTHAVTFAHEGESITLKYQTENPSAFAEGALGCAVLLLNHKTAD